MPNDVAHWLSVCRSHICDHGQTIKIAAIGGDGNDASFEQSFSNLGHAFLRDRAPTLLDHELGFQLLDRNDDNTKAVGAFAFKVGSQNLFAPVFFLRGDLKGHELLYLKNQDLFVPLKENWLNYILNRKPNIIGTGVARQTSTLGVRQPDLNRLSKSPYKYASAVIPSLHPFLPVYGHLATSNFREALDNYTGHCRERLDLSHFMKQASLPMLQVVVNLFQQKPKIAAAFDRWYGMDTLRTAIKEAKARMDVKSVLDDPYAQVHRLRNFRPTTGSIIDAWEKDAADGDKGPDVHQQIKIITMESSATELPQDITEEDQEKLLRDHVLIKDHRKGEEVSVALNVQVEQRLTNPTETGIYQVMTKPGDFEKCLIVVDPHGPDGRKHLVTVVRLDGARNWGNFPRGDVWVAGLSEELLPGGEDSWNKWFDALPDGDLSVESKSRYIMVGPRRNATLPFRIEKEIGNSQGTTSYDVEFSCGCGEPTLSLGLNTFPRQTFESFDEYKPWRDGQRLHIDSKDGTDLRSNRGDLYVPKGYKVLRVEQSEDDESREDGPISCSMHGDSSSNPPPIVPGCLLDATLSIMKKTAELKINYTSSGYSINGAAPIPTVPAVVHLVRDHGLREDTSRHLLKLSEAKSRTGNPFTCRIKYANPHLTHGGPTAPAITEPPYGDYNPMGFQGRTQSLYEEEFPVPDLQAGLTDPMIYNVNPDFMPEPMDANNVANAAASGQREFFDMSMIGSMLKAVRDDTMIDRFLPDVIKGMDRLGRILFMFYWHQDQFAKRYGKHDLPAMEDSLRNGFEIVGDLVLELTQKSVTPFIEEDLQQIDLDAIANIS